MRVGSGVGHWSALPDRDLLQLRFSDLDLRIEGSGPEPRINQLHAELEHKGLRFRPHCWLAEEWFSPDGVPGIAIPFYLAHPRLMRLEKTMMLDVEGGSEEEGMRILRHEAGHAIDSAYRLRRRAGYRTAFGSPTVKYPDAYRPRPFSKSFVLHLGLWYAQSHPCEDFAETFAVWLRAGSRWRSQYRGWPALRKLRYVDGLIAELAGKPALVRSRRHVEPLRTVRKTLHQHYADKRSRYGVDLPHVYDRDLRRLFASDAKDRHRETAVRFLRRHRVELRELVAQWTGAHQYTIDQVLEDMMNRCRDLRLRTRRGEAQNLRNALLFLSVQTTHHLHGFGPVLAL